MRRWERLVLLALGTLLLALSGLGAYDHTTCYEFVEWISAVLGGSAATDFLGTQGDVWDTQWDMLFALMGALTAQLLLARLHDRELGRLEQEG